MNAGKIALVGLVVLAVLLVLWLGPLATILALNTLFALSIGYTLKTWAAALVLFGALAGSRARSS